MIIFISFLNNEQVQYSDPGTKFFRCLPYSKTKMRPGCFNMYNYLVFNLNGLSICKSAKLPIKCQNFGLFQINCCAVKMWPVFQNKDLCLVELFVGPVPTQQTRMAQLVV